MDKVPTFVLRKHPRGKAHWVRVGVTHTLCMRHVYTNWAVTTPERAQDNVRGICRGCAYLMRYFGMKGHE